MVMLTGECSLTLTRSLTHRFLVCVLLGVVELCAILGSDCSTILGYEWVERIIDLVYCPVSLTGSADCGQIEVVPCAVEYVTL